MGPSFIDACFGILACGSLESDNILANKLSRLVKRSISTLKVRRVSVNFTDDDSRLFPSPDF
jgi:hypothetical protein